LAWEGPSWNEETVTDRLLRGNRITTANPQSVYM
jgi:hypothetical protein